MQRPLEVIYKENPKIHLLHSNFLFREYINQQIILLSFVYVFKAI